MAKKQDKAKCEKLKAQILNMEFGSKFKHKKTKSFDFRVPNYRSDADIPRIPSHYELYGPVVTSDAQSNVSYRDNEEMLEREQRAREEIERKKKRVAVVYNKGPYQYLWDDYDATTIGRK